MVGPSVGIGGPSLRYRRLLRYRRYNMPVWIQEVPLYLQVQETPLYHRRCPVGIVGPLWALEALRRYRRSLCRQRRPPCRHRSSFFIGGPSVCKRNLSVDIGDLSVYKLPLLKSQQATLQVKEASLWTYESPLGTGGPSVGNGKSLQVQDTHVGRKGPLQVNEALCEHTRTSVSI